MAKEIVRKSDYVRLSDIQKQPKVDEAIMELADKYKLPYGKAIVMMLTDYLELKGKT